MTSKATLQRHFNEVTRLEQRQATRVGRVLAEARNELAERLAKGAASSSAGYYLREWEAIAALLPEKAREAYEVELIAEGGTRQALDQLRESMPANTSLGSFRPFVSPTLLAVEADDFTRRISDVAASTRSDIDRAIRLGLANGEGTAQLQARVLGEGIRGRNGRDGVFRSARYRSEMIARTGANEVTNKAKHLTYQQYDTESPGLTVRKGWYNISDSRSSDVCLALNGQWRLLHESFSAMGGSWKQPGAHPQCRSTLIVEVKRD